MEFNSKIYNQVVKWEGTTIENVEGDMGGLTNTGITYKYYKVHCKNVFGKNPTLKHFTNLTLNDKKAMYKEMWNRLQLNDLTSFKVATCVYDFCFNSQFAIREIQEVLISYGLPIVADNIIGPQTIKALNDAIVLKTEKVLLEDLINKRIEYVTYISKKPNQSKFLKGWLNRINDLKTFLDGTI
jgi:lysozyme family protein